MSTALPDDDKFEVIPNGGKSRDKGVDAGQPRQL